MGRRGSMLTPEDLRVTYPVQRTENGPAGFDIGGRVWSPEEVAAEVLIVYRLPRGVLAVTVTRKFSFCSTVVSPVTDTLTVPVVAPAAIVTVPVGNVPPTKSAVFAGFPSPTLLTAQFSVIALVAARSRVTVKV